MNVSRKNEGKRWQQTIGEIGESLARKYFENNGYQLLATNWRHGHWEIDIIASKDSTLHIIEVKTRHNDVGGLPEENVTRKKLNTLTKAAEVFMGNNNHWSALQFDILAIKLSQGKPDIVLIEDVYF